jgi:acyl-homoserine-lactone acylase
VVQDRIPGQLQDLYVLDGSRSACSWEKDPTTIEPGLLPASQMATIYRRDFVQNSNDSYRWTNPAEVLKLGPIMGRDPGLGGLRTRAGIQEITAVLRSGKFDIDLAAQTMLSNRWLAADLVLPSLRNLCTRPTAPADACAALAGWDGKAEIDSRGAMLFNLFWAKIGNRLDIWRVGPDPNDPLNTPRDFVTEGRTGDELLAALRSAADTMLGLGLPPDAALGQVQFAERGDERIPISGAQYGGVLNYMKTVPASKGFSVIHGSSYIQSVTFDGEGPIAKAVLTYSQSTNPASPFFSDQTREFSNKTLHSFPYTEAEIAADAIGAPLVIRQ